MLKLHTELFYYNCFNYYFSNLVKEKNVYFYKYSYWQDKVNCKHLKYICVSVKCFVIKKNKIEKAE